MKNLLYQLRKNLNILCVGMIFCHGSFASNTLNRWNAKVSAPVANMSNPTSIAINTYNPDNSDIQKLFIADGSPVTSQANQLGKIFIADVLLGPITHNLQALSAQYYGWDLNIPLSVTVKPDKIFIAMENRDLVNSYDPSFNTTVINSLGAMGNSKSVASNFYSQNIFIAQTNNNKVVKTDTQLSTPISIPANYNFSHPISVAEDSVGNVYVLTTGAGPAFTKVTPPSINDYQNATISTIPLSTNQPNTPNYFSLGVDSKQNIYITDLANSQIIQAKSSSSSLNSYDQSVVFSKPSDTIYAVTFDLHDNAYVTSSDSTGGKITFIINSYLNITSPADGTGSPSDGTADLCENSVYYNLKGVSGSIINTHGYDLTVMLSNEPNSASIFNGDISGPGSFTLNLIPNSNYPVFDTTMTFGGANSYSGGTNINGTSLVLVDNGSLNSNGDVRLTANAVFDISGIHSSTAIGNLITTDNTSNVVNLGPKLYGSTGNDLTSNLTHDVNFAGSIRGVAKFTLAGFGKMTITNPHYYQGGTDIAGQTVLAMRSGSRLYQAGDIVLKDNGQFDVTQADSGTTVGDIYADNTSQNTLINLGSNKLIFGFSNNSDFYGHFTGTSAAELVKQGTGVTSFYGSSDITKLSIMSGGIALKGNATIPSNTNVSVRGIALGYIIVNPTTTTPFVGSTFNYQSASPAPAISNGSFDISGLNAAQITVGDVTGGNSSSVTNMGGNISLGTKSLLFGTNTPLTVFNGTSSGSGQLIKQGTGTWRVVPLSNVQTNNAYSLDHTGGVIVRNGTIIISKDINLGRTYDAVNYPNATLTLGYALNQAILQFDADTPAGTTINRPIITAGAGGVIDTSNNEVTFTQGFSGTAPITKTSTSNINNGSMIVNSLTTGVPAISVPLIIDAGGVTLSDTTNNINYNMIQGNVQIGDNTNKTTNLRGAGNIQGNVLVNNLGIYSNTGKVSGDVLVNGGGSFAGAGNIGRDVTINNGGIFNGNGNVGRDVIINSGGTFVSVGNVGRNVSVNNGSTFNGVGSIGGDVSVSNGGIFAGIGNVAGHVTNSGHVAPGNSPGIRTVNSYTANPGSFLDIYIQPTGGLFPVPGVDNAELIVTQTVDVSGSYLNIIPATGSYQEGASYKFLSSPNGVTGNFSNQNDVVAVGPYQAIITRDANSDYLTFIIKHINLNANSSTDQKHVGDYFNAIPTPAIGTDLADVIGAIGKLGLLSSSDQADAALDAVSPERDSTTGLVHIENSSMMHGITTARLTSLRRYAPSHNRIASSRLRFGQMGQRDAVTTMLNHKRGQMMATHLKMLSNPDSVNAVGQGVQNTNLGAVQADAQDNMNQQLQYSNGQGGMWVHTMGQHIRQKERSDNYGYHANTGGIIAGLDKQISSSIYAGIGIGHSQSHLKLDRGGGTGHIKSYFATLYTTYFKGPLHIDAALLGGVGQHKMNRTISFTGFKERAAKNTHSSYEIAPHIGAGYKIPVFKTIEIEPFAGVDYTMQKEKGYQETGANSINYYIRPKLSRYLRTESGLNVIKTTSYEGYKVSLIAKIGYVYKKSWNLNTVQASLIGYDSNILNVTGANVHSHQVSPGLEATIAAPSNTAVAVRYNAELGKSYTNHQLMLKVNKKF